MSTNPDDFSPSQARRLQREHGRAAAVSYMEPFIARSQIEAMIGMADLEYDEGHQERSVQWMHRAERATAADDFVTPIYLASAYERGLGGGTHAERQAKALAAKERVAQSGNVVMQHALMSEYLYGLNGVPVSKERFTYWATRAAELGSKEAAKALKKLHNWPHVAPEDP